MLSRQNFPSSLTGSSSIGVLPQDCLPHVFSVMVQLVAREANRNVKRPSCIVAVIMHECSDLGPFAPLVRVYYGDK
jgi:hypothetical protein